MDGTGEKQSSLDAALVEALLDDDSETALSLLDQGADANAEVDGDTALSCAINDTLVDVVEQLVERGADINAPGEDGSTHLIDAIDYGHRKVAKLLILKGAQVNVLGGEFDDGSGGKSPLMVAADNGDCEIGRLLLKHGANPNGFANREGYTALHEAVYRGHGDFVELLVKHGADINARLTALGSDDTPFEAALKQKDRSCARILFRETERLAPQALGTPLHAAAYLCDEPLTESLIGEDVEPRDYQGKTPLHWVAGRRQPHLPGLILEFAGLQSEHGRGKSSQRALATLLLKNGASIDARDCHNATPLLDAGQWGQWDTAYWLIESGADVNASDDVGWTALHLAACAGRTGMLTTLLDRGADIDVARMQDWTALTFAIHSKQAKGAKLLLERGASVAASASVLHMAIQRGCTTVVPLLVESGANLEEPDGEGRTPLQVAQQQGNAQLIAMLKVSN